MCYIGGVLPGKTRSSKGETQMMDIATLAPLVVSAVVPLLKKGAEKLAEKTAEEGFEQRGKIWNLVKGMFTEDDLTLLNLFERNPEDGKTQGKLEGKLEDRLKSNPEIAEQLDQLLKEIKIGQQNISTIHNEDVKDNSEISNEIEQHTRQSLTNESLIENRSVSSSKIINKIAQK